MSDIKVKIVIVLFIVAFLVRFSAVLTMHDIHAGPTRAFGADGIEFNDLGYQVALGNGYELRPLHPTAFRAPGFPLLLAGIYFLAGENFPLVYVVFCLLGAVACVLTFLIASEMVGPTQAAFAGGFAVIYASSVYDVTVFASENLFVVCLGLCVWAFLRYLKSGSPTELLISAVSLGYGILTRPFALLLLPLFLLALFWKSRKSAKVMLKHAGLLAFTALALVAPWTIRNYNVFHRFIPVADNGGSTFYGGNNDRVLHDPKYYGGWISTTELPERPLIDAQPDEVSHDHEEWVLGVGWVKEHARSMPLLCLYKLVRLWLPDFASANRKYVTMQVIGVTPILILTLLGQYRCLSRRSYWTIEWLTLQGVIVMTVLTALIFWGSPRFRDANLPVLMLFAVIGLEALLSRKSTTHNPSV